MEPSWRRGNDIRNPQSTFLFPESSSPISPLVPDRSPRSLRFHSRSPSEGSRNTTFSDSSDRSPRNQRLPRTRVFYASRGRQVIGIYGRDGQVREKVEHFEKLTDWKVSYDGSQLPSMVDDDEDMEDDLDADYEKVGGTFYTAPMGTAKQMTNALSSPKEREMSPAQFPVALCSADVELNDKELSLLSESNLQLIKVGPRKDNETFLLNQNQDLDSEPNSTRYTVEDRQKYANDIVEFHPKVKTVSFAKIGRHGADAQSLILSDHGASDGDPDDKANSHREFDSQIQQLPSPHHGIVQARRAISSMSPQDLFEPLEMSPRSPRQISALDPDDVELNNSLPRKINGFPEDSIPETDPRAKLRTPNLVTRSTTLHKGIRGVPPQMCGTRPAESRALRKPVQDVIKEDWTAQLQRNASREQEQIQRRAGITRQKAGQIQQREQVVVPTEGKVGLMSRFRLRRGRKRRTCPGPEPHQFGAAQAISPRK